MTRQSCQTMWWFLHCRAGYAGTSRKIRHMASASTDDVVHEIHGVVGLLLGPAELQRAQWTVPARRLRWCCWTRLLHPCRVKQTLRMHNVDFRR
jgi:hypothetical protein